MEKLFVWKFIIPHNKYVPLKSDSGIAFSGCMTVAVAETEALAREAVTKYAAENGFDCRWMEVADVRRLELASGAVLGWVMA